MDDFNPTPIEVIEGVLDDFCARHGLDRTNIERAPTPLNPPIDSFVLYKGNIYQYVGQERYRRVSLVERMWLWVTKRI